MITRTFFIELGKQGAEFQEELSRAFLRAHAHPDAARETFIGDRRT